MKCLVFLFKKDPHYELCICFSKYYVWLCNTNEELTWSQIRVFKIIWQVFSKLQLDGYYKIYFRNMKENKRSLVFRKSKRLKLQVISCHLFSLLTPNKYIIYCSLTIHSMAISHIHFFASFYSGISPEHIAQRFWRKLASIEAIEASCRVSRWISPMTFCQMEFLYLSLQLNEGSWRY